MKLYREILKKNLGRVMGTALLTIIHAFAMTFAGYSLSFLFTAYEYGGDRTRALLYTFAIVTGIWLIAMGLYYLAYLARAGMARHFKNDLRRMMSEKIVSLSHAEFTGKDCGHYVSWLTNDVEQIYSQSFSALFSSIENIAMTVFSFGALWLFSPYIGIAGIVLLVVIVTVPKLTAKRLERANAARSEALETSTERYKDVIMGGSIFILANLRNRICQRILSASEKAEKVCYQFNRTNLSAQMLISTVSMVAQVILLFVTLLASAAGTTPAGATLSVGNLAGSFFGGAAVLVEMLMTIRASRPLWEKFELEAVAEDAGKREIEAVPEIRLEHVSFCYGDRQVLQDRNDTFRIGGKYAIMGESGSGKTTLTRLILGLLPGYEGAVRYGGLEQREASLESLYRHVAYVDQQVYLFQDSLRFNLTLGEAYSDREIMEVVCKCRLEGFVRSLPEGLDTVILENGKNLSGGQRQRIALARALLRGVEYLILDEGTSALDEANAVEIETGLLEEARLGVILITHNLRDSVREKLTDVYRLPVLQS